ncbi:uncharacterized protein J3D65DRAFT_617057 [Phyllosticta citribraziliensis]|uniref:Uncharacterized protein n=1 Tax=Phyllosticta citribraziliensis TaxID=989973 RepID=A0ABR1M0J4_9PEZI
MKVSFISLFAFAGIFAGALAAPAPGAAVDTAVIEKRDVVDNAIPVVTNAVPAIKKTSAAIQAKVQSVKENTLDRSAAVTEIQVLLQDLNTELGELKNGLTGAAVAKLRARQTGDAINTLAAAVAEIVTEVFNALSAVSTILNLTTGTLATVVRTLAATLSALLTTVLGFNDQLVVVLNGLVDGTLIALNNILGGLLNGVADLLDGLLGIL